MSDAYHGVTTLSYESKKKKVWSILDNDDSRGQGNEPPATPTPYPHWSWERTAEGTQFTLLLGASLGCLIADLAILSPWHCSLHFSAPNPHPFHPFFPPFPAFLLLSWGILLSVPPLPARLNSWSISWRKESPNYTIFVLCYWKEYLYLSTFKK